MTVVVPRANSIAARFIPRLFLDDWTTYLQVEQVREACRLIARGRM